MITASVCYDTEHQIYCSYKDGTIRSNHCSLTAQMKYYEIPHTDADNARDQRFRDETLALTE